MNRNVTVLGDSGLGVPMETSFWVEKAGGVYSKMASRSSDVRIEPPWG
jgi:hypothetical protein